MRTKTQTERRNESAVVPTAPVLLNSAPAGALPLRPRWRRFLSALVMLALLWALLTDFRPDTWAFGLPAVLAGAALVFVLPGAPGWRLSLSGSLAFALWFAVKSLHGATDVAIRAIAPRMPLRPGFRAFTPALPQGAPRVMFVNTITLLPGTLSAEIAGDAVIVHMLDTRTDLDADLAALETRIAAMFGLTLAMRRMT